MCTKTPKAPPPPAVLPEAPRAPDGGDSTTTNDMDERRRRAAAGQGASGTILTGPRGAAGTGSAPGKTLLGQ